MRISYYFTLVVERVRQFVTHDNTHGTVVERALRARIVEGRLQDAIGDGDLILSWRVEGVHRRRRHAPPTVGHAVRERLG